MNVLDRRSSFVATTSADAIPSGIKSGSSGPLTPPHTHMDLPTPPSSSVELSTSTQPPTKRQNPTDGLTALDANENDAEKARNGAETNGVRSASPTMTIATTNDAANAEQSPSIVAHQRKVKRISAGGTGTTVVNIAGKEMDGDAQQDQRGRSREPINVNGVEAGPSSSSRSRTPSPILGSVLSTNGRLSFSAALQPSAEEVRSLLYGENGEDDDEASRPRSVGQDDMKGLLESLNTMGLASADVDMTSADASKGMPREIQLASMVKKLVNHARKQDEHIDRMEASLHNTRLRSISLLSSVRTTFAHSFATEYELRARLQAELDGAKAQARKLSQLLARSESRNEEVERERAASAEEEIMWQEEMKDHASAYARQQAARARAAQLAQQSQRNGMLDSPSKKARQAVTPGAETTIVADETPIIANGSSPPLPSGGLDEPFEERKPSRTMGSLPQSHSDGSLAGLGISSSGAVQIDAPAGSPLSTIIKERNKLLADKRYLKARVRDSEAQRDRLELELKSLRPILVRGVPSKSTVSAQLTATPTTPGRSQKRDRSRRRRQAVMGDAEAEHLLLAARRLQSTRKPPFEDGRPSTPPPASVRNGVTGVPRTPRTPRTVQTPRSIAMADPSLVQSAASTSRTDGLESRGLAVEASPLAGRAMPVGRWGSHQRVDSARSAGGIDDLLQAAQTVLQPGERRAEQSNARGYADAADHAQVHYGSEADEEDEAEFDRELVRRKDHLAHAPSVDDSPKRRRVSSAAPGHNRRRSLLSTSPEKSAFFAAVPRRMRNHTEGAELADDVPHASQASALSALDLLADQAAASQVPSQSSEQSHSGEGETFAGAGGRSDDSDDGMHVDHAGPNGTPHMGTAHYYGPPRASYGHMYPGPPPPPPPHHPLGHDAYRIAAAPVNASGGYGYGSGGSPATLSSQGWTSQTVPPGRGSIYSPPSSQHARFFQSGPRISSGFVANMQDGSRLAKAGQTTPRMMNGAGSFGGGGGGGGGHMAAMTYDDDDDEDGGGGGGGGTQRTPQKGGNTSPDKRLPYVRWSEEEDQKLRRAIGEYGQRWESVARVVGTRTYHQCRQRYLLMRRKEAAARDGGDENNSVSSPV